MTTALRFRLNWIPQGPNAPFLLAADAGFLRDEGIALEFQAGTSSSAVAAAIRRGEADLGFGDVSSVVEAGLKDPPAEIRCLMSVYERAPMGLAYYRETADFRLTEIFEGEVVGPPHDTSARLLSAILAANDIDRTISVVEVPPAERDRRLVSGEAVAATAFDSTIRFSFAAAGLDIGRLHFWYFADHGLDIYSSAVVASTRLLDDQPTIAGRLIRAFSRGWVLAAAEPDAAVAAVMQRASDANPEIVRAHLDWILRKQIGDGLAAGRFGTFERAKAERTIHAARGLVGSDAEIASEALMHQESLR